MLTLMIVVTLISLVLSITALVLSIKNKKQ